MFRSTLTIFKSRYQTQFKPKKPEIQNETAVLHPNLQNFEQY